MCLDLPVVTLTKEQIQHFKTYKQKCVDLPVVTLTKEQIQHL